MKPLRGHEEARRALVRAHRSGSIPQPLLIHGAPGVGKQRLALWIGQLVLCRTPDEAGPCGQCKDCRLVLHLEHPDLHWFFPLARPSGTRGPDRLAEVLEEARAEELEKRREEGLWSIRSDEVRGLYLAMARTLRKKAQRKPAMSDRQIFLIAEAEELVPQASSPEAANALLKLLEEPPEGTDFILTSSRPGRLLPTVRSRSFPLHLPGLSDETVRRFLEEEVAAEPDAARKAAQLAQGSIGRALEYLPEDDDEAGPLEELREASFHLLRAGLSDRIAEGLALAHDYPVSGARGLLDRFAHLEEWLRDLAAAAAGEEDHIVNRDAREYLARMVREKGIHPRAAARALEPVEEARRLASGNVNPQLIAAGLIRDLRRILLSDDRITAPSASPSSSPSGTRGRSP